MNIRWGLGFTDIQNVNTERTEFKGVLKPNLINGFGNYEQK